MKKLHWLFMAICLAVMPALQSCDEGDCLTTNPESEGDRLPATYANFLILNKAVIYPTYNQPEKDEEARKQIQLAFPDREIIGVDSQTIIRQHAASTASPCSCPREPSETQNSTLNTQHLTFNIKSKK